MTGVYVRVRVAGEHYALPVERVLEVAETGAVTPVPGAPAHIVGVRNLRGEVLPVVDLTSAIGLGPGAGDGRDRIVVLEAAGRRAGLAVDGLIGVTELPEVTEQPGQRFVHATAVVDGELVGVLEAGAVLEAAGAGGSA